MYIFNNTYTKQISYCPDVRYVDGTEVIDRKVHPIVHVS